MPLHTRKQFLYVFGLVETCRHRVKQLPHLADEVLRMVEYLPAKGIETCQKRRVFADVSDKSQ